ncbi:tRNA-dependent cyclodipeptide synthase [Hoeflea poritis]|uniref:Cyclodipeptide synthase n=1 Tax=Hoeflea poritis TaxID=2993659 RepID=A0ABT4VVI3_9HYPH|nr:tRNA-dependent cyclodipeptide synthase [Hoeflea poritis]MDA4848733.1 tRNA-dependent cyclodipeptide synthase [Hoeflea poritis]
MKTEANRNYDQDLIHSLYEIRNNDVSGAEHTSEKSGDVTRVLKRRYRSQMQSVSPKTLENGVLKDNDSCVLGISLGNPSMEMAKLEACIEWISIHFDKCALNLTDTLYRHTLQVTQGVSAEQSRDQALKVGDAFQETYAPLIDRYSGKCGFQWIRSSEIENRKNFNSYLNYFQGLYEENEEYQNIVNDFSKIYLERVSNLDRTLDPRQKMECSTNYLIEETAMITCLCEEDWNILVYPGSIKSFVDIAEGHFSEVPEPLRKIIFISLRLKKAGFYLSDSIDGFYPAFVGAGTARSPTYPLLARLDKSELETLLDYASIREFRAGDVILRSEERATSVFFPLDGYVEILEGDINAQTMKQTAILGPGMSIGEQSLLDGNAPQATVAAYTDCKLMVLPEKRFERMLVSEPYITSQLLLDIGRMMSLRQRGVF